MTRQNNIPLPGKDFKYISQGDPVVYPTLVPGKLNKKKWNKNVYNVTQIVYFFQIVYEAYKKV